MTSLGHSATVQLHSFSSPFARAHQLVSEYPFDFQHLLTLNHWFLPDTVFFSVSVCSLFSPGFLRSPETCHFPSSSDAILRTHQSSFSTNKVLNLGFRRDCPWGEAVANEVKIDRRWGGVALCGLGPRGGVDCYDDTLRGGWLRVGKPDSWPGEALAQCWGISLSSHSPVPGAAASWLIWLVFPPGFLCKQERPSSVIGLSHILERQPERPTGPETLS